LKEKGKTRRIGLPFGCHRVVKPKGLLPQAAQHLDCGLPIYSNEVLIDVLTLNLDSASFEQMKEEGQKKGENLEDFISQKILQNVRENGKQVNPVTGSGGMLIGQVLEVGEDYSGPCPLAKGDRLATLVSLTLTPLSLEKINKVHLEGRRQGQLEVKGKALLFDGAPAAKIPTNLSEELVLSILDVCGAPAEVSRRVRPGQNVFILGAGGKSGLLCLYEARKKLGSKGQLLAIDYSERGLKALQKSQICDQMAQIDARNSVQVFQKVSEWTKGQLADVVINTTNISETEMAAILSARPGGLVYFFNMATRFSRAALGAEGVGKDVQLLMGNGYVPGHAELALNLVREHRDLLEMLGDH